MHRIANRRTRSNTGTTCLPRKACNTLDPNMLRMRPVLAHPPAGKLLSEIMQCFSRQAQAQSEATEGRRLASGMYLLNNKINTLHKFSSQSHIFYEPLHSQFFL